MTEQALAVMS